jgi:protein involved in polysaccharide export with SLBB domain
LGYALSSLALTAMLGLMTDADAQSVGANTANTANTAASTPGASYRINRGDELDLRFIYTAELNTKALVRSDGRISLPLIGELIVEGRTVEELTTHVATLLASQVKRTELTINVTRADPLRIFVGGEVVRPGMQALTGPMTALQAVMAAEGIKDTGLPSNALVLRRNAQGGHDAISLNLDALMTGRQLDGDVALQAFDIVVVPRSGIADLGRWVDLYIRRVLPVSFGISYSFNRGEVSR